MKKLSLSILLALPAGLVHAGGFSDGGGDLMRLKPQEIRLKAEASNKRKKQVEAFIRESLKKRLQFLIKHMNVPQIDTVTADLPPPFRSIRHVLKYARQRFLDDIEKSTYVISEDSVYFPLHCRDLRCEKDARTRGVPTAEVVFNLERISRYDISIYRLQEALIGLAFHEHVRHLGYPDEAHQLGKMALAAKAYDNYEVAPELSSEQIKEIIHDVCEIKHYYKYYKAEALQKSLERCYQAVTHQLSYKENGREGQAMARFTNFSQWTRRKFAERVTSNEMDRMYVHSYLALRKLLKPTPPFWGGLN